MHSLEAIFMYDGPVDCKLLTKARHSLEENLKRIPEGLWVEGTPLSGIVLFLHSSAY